MPALARIISSHIDYAAVTDRTSLQGSWDVYLEFSGASHQLMTGSSAAPGLTASQPADSDSGPIIFQAVERQLGLRLEKVRNTPFDVFVIDRAEKMPMNN